MSSTAEDEVAVDSVLLGTRDAFEDAGMGIGERFLRLELRSGGTFGVLSTSLRGARPPGYVICHSFGSEEMDLHPAEVAIARALAASGHPVLRFQCQGYGDSEHVAALPSVASHVSDTQDAVRVMRAIAGVDEIGLVGARFGAMIAALVARRLGLRHLALVAPFVRGTRFVTELLRHHMMTQTLEVADDHVDGLDRIRASLSAGGVVNIKGFTLNGDSVAEIGAVDLTDELQGFDGDLLVAQLSLGPKPQQRLRQLVEEMERRGSRVTFTILTDPSIARFGHDHFQESVGIHSADVLTELTEKLAGAVADWAKDHPRARTETGGDAE